MSQCTDCIEKAKVRNRDMNAALKQAKENARQDKKPFSVCWKAETGLYVSDAISAIQSGATIRHIVSHLRETTA